MHADAWLVLLDSIFEICRVCSQAAPAHMRWTMHLLWTMHYAMLTCAHVLLHSCAAPGAAGAAVH